MKNLFLYVLIFCPICLLGQTSTTFNLLEEVEHHYVENDGVKIHYVSIGEGPTVVMLHGFPDYWYTWRDQIVALKDHFRVVAVDLRGYNLSGQPEGVEAYKMQHLVGDVRAVIQAQKDEKAILVGHDWGGMIAWQTAIRHPELIEKLIVCNMTHPTGYSHASLAQFQANGNTSYMDDFRKHTSETLPISWLSGWVKDEEAKKHYEAAFKRSSIDGMVNYYRANSLTKEQRAEWLKNPTVAELPKVQIPVLVIFGTKDQYVLKEGLNDTWEWLAEDFTLVTIPTAAHFVQQDASELVSKSMKMWLLRDELDISPSRLADLSWLLGKWKRERGDKPIYEYWHSSSESTFEGISYKTVESHGHNIPVPLEELRLLAMGDDIFYVPKVSENEFPIPFKLVENVKHNLLFENASHDFPQRIRYQLKDDGVLEVTIGDVKWEKTVKFVFERVE